MKLENFLTNFYDTISFEHGEPFKSEQFRELFAENAVLIEKDGTDFSTKTVKDHIHEFEVAIAKYPELFAKGFHEIQLSYEAIPTDDYILVSSKYQKAYCRSGNDSIEIGTNVMTLARKSDTFVIVSIAW